MLKRIAFLALIIVPFAALGAARLPPTRDINDFLLADALAIDAEGYGVTLTALAEIDGEPEIVSAAAPTLKDAIEEISKGAAGCLFLGHTRYLLVSGDFKLTDYIAGDPKSHTGMYVYAVKGNAAETLETDKLTERLRSLEDYNVTLVRAQRDAAVIPALKDGEFDGFAVLKEREIAGFVPEELTETLRLFREGKVSFDYNFRDNPTLFADVNAPCAAGEAERLINLSKTLKADFLGVAAALDRKHPFKFAGLRGDWENTEYEVKVIVNG